MENFNKLSDIILTFHIGVSTLDKKSYYIVKRPISEAAYGPEMTKLQADALTDLIDVEPERAKRHIGRLRIAMDGIGTYADGVHFNYIMDRFTLLCNTYNVVVEQDNGGSDVIVTSNFDVDLENEIWTRANIIERLTRCLFEVTDDLPQELPSIYSNQEYVIETHIPLPGEVPDNEWLKIVGNEDSSFEDAQFKRSANSVLTSKIRNLQQEQFHCYNDLFNSEFKEFIDQFNSILRDVSPVLINSKDEWIGAKAAAKIFRNSLLEYGVIKKSTKTHTAKLFDERFKDLGKNFFKEFDSVNIDESYGTDIPERIELVINDIKTLKK